jgi:hypothetical protein
MGLFAWAREALQDALVREGEKSKLLTNVSDAISLISAGARKLRKCDTLTDPRVDL